MPLTIPMPAGKMLSSDGTTYLDKYPPGYLLAVDLGTNFSNSLTETSVLSAGAITGGFPAGVAVGDTVQIRAAGKHVNNTGANQTLTLAVYMAGTQIATAVTGNLAANANQRQWQIELEVIYTVIAGGGAGAIRPIGQMVVASTGTGWQGLTATSAYLFNDGVSQSITTNAAASVDLKATMSTNTAGGAVTCNIFRARHFPKNY